MVRKSLPQECILIWTQTFFSIETEKNDCNAVKLFAYVSCHIILIYIQLFIDLSYTRVFCDVKDRCLDCNQAQLGPWIRPDGWLGITQQLKAKNK